MVNNIPINRLVFGSPDHYYSESSPPPKTKPKEQETQEEKFIRDILETYQEKPKAKVERAYKQWNTIARDHLRQETGLRLSIGNNKQVVPIVVCDGLPYPLLELISQFKEPLFWELVYNRQLLVVSEKCLKILTDNYLELEHWKSLKEWPGSKENLHNCQALIKSIINELDYLELKKRFQLINQDSLGAYFFNIPQIQLYWMAIGLVAGIIDVPIEALTLVALTHELAHAYTHQGMDIDEKRWKTENFGNTDSHIVEGLAQFYTESVCMKLEERYPFALTAYKQLINLQSGPYVVHKNWVQNVDNRNEIIRFALIQTRLRSISHYDDFHEELIDINNHFNRRKTYSKHDTFI